MRIHGSFVGGNIRVACIDGQDIYLEQEIRDTTTWWFYWAFCVEGAEGQTLTFHFVNQNVVGYWGPAVSHDNVEYTWAGSRIDGTTFQYTFSQDEKRVFFRYAIPYQVTNYENWLRKQTAPIHTDVLCLTERGRNVPMFILGDAAKKNTVIFTSRHHACESMATWALEGAVEAFIQNMDRLEKLDANLLVIPFVDLDGVEDGDQGKNRAPHDQNRDYLDQPHYNVIRAICELPKRYHVIGYIDFHDPWYLGDVNDYLCLLRNPKGEHHITDDFAKNLEKETAFGATEKDIVYKGEHDLYPGELWVPLKRNPTTSISFFRRSGVDMSISIEIPYFGTPEFVYDQTNVKRLGGCIGRALISTLEE